MPPILKKRASVWFIVVIVALGCIILLLFAPTTIYLNFYALFRPQAITVDNQSVTWTQLKESLELAELDKRLKTKREKLDTAINQAVEVALLRKATNFSINPNLSLYDQIQQMRKIINQDSVNWRDGGFFITRFVVPQATESAEVLKQQAKTEINKIQIQLNKGDGLQKILNEAEKNKTIARLNTGAYLPGMYLEKITEDKFPLEFKNLKDTFFSLPAASVSGILTLSAEDYYGLKYKPNASGEFAYAVVKIDKTNPRAIKSYADWVTQQRLSAQVKNYLFMPFFFNWF